MAVSGSPIAIFTDMMASTPDAYASAPSQFAALLDRKNWFLNRMAEHQPLGSQRFQAVTITDKFINKVNLKGRYIRPNAEVRYGMHQTFLSWSITPSLFMDYMAWTRWEMASHGITRDLKGGVLRQKLKDWKMKLYREQRLAQAEQFEQDLMAAPSYADMEGPDAYKPRSLWCYYNEGLTTDWTTLQSINQTAVPQFDCQRVTADYSGSGAASGWFTGMDVLTKRSEYESVPYDGPQTDQGRPKKEILCSMWGWIHAVEKLRGANQNLYPTPNDAGRVMPLHNGMQLRYVDAMDDLAIWDDGSGNYNKTEDTADITGPRYVMVDYSAYRAAFHAETFFYNHGTREAFTVPGTVVQPVETWWTTYMVDPRTGGVLSPSADVAVPAWMS